MKLRDYQQAAVNSLFDYFEDKSGNPIIVLPTGTGKSLVLGAAIRQAYEAYPQTRILKLTHVKELIEQNLEKLLALWPTAPAGVYSNGLGRKDTGYPITFGGIATVAKKAREFGHIDLVFIDECHLVSPRESTMYQQTIKALAEINPRVKVIGLTATDYRLGVGKLTDGDNSLFTDVCFDMSKLDSFNWFINEGYLVPLVPKRTRMELDVSEVHITGGEFKQNELQAAVDKQELTYAAIQEVFACAGERRHWLIFASGIEHTLHVRDMLDSLGVPVTCVHSKMGDVERDAAIADFKTGKYVAMVNSGILTTGFDYPAIDLIVMLRPTHSPSLWVQMLGRGTRPNYAEGFDLSTTEGRLTAIANSEKQNCLVLDFAGNTKRLGPINDPVLPRKKGKKAGVAPIRICEQCDTINHASARTCTYCGADFPPPELKIRTYAGTDELITNGIPVTEVFAVDRVVYTEHRKEGRPSTIQASYYCGLRMFKEWICLEHSGFAAKKARDWWRERSLSNNPPETIAEAFLRLHELRAPTHINVWIKPKYDEIIAYDYTGLSFNHEEM